MFGEILPIRTPGVTFHVLRDGDELVLVDTGMIKGRACLQAALRHVGWEDLPIKTILLTHGHLDHIFNTHDFAQRTDAQVLAPQLDHEHYVGEYPYRGLARICGALEALGRAVLRFKAFTVDRYLSDGDVIDVWDGLQAVHLPGHTVGHMGYYSRSRRLLFSGDLMASYWHAAYTPPAYFNSCPEQYPTSFTRILKLDIDQVYPNHCHKPAPEFHCRRLKKLALKFCPV